MTLRDHYNALREGTWNDGGVDRWPGLVVILGCLLMEFTVFGIFDTFPTYQELIHKDASAGNPSLEQISVADAINNSLNPIIGVFSGYLLPYIGGRFCCIFSVSMTFLYLWLTACFTKDIITLYLCFPLPGSFSVAFMLPVVLALAASWFDKYRSFAMALCNVGGGLGMTVVPALVGQILAHSSWRTSVKYSSAFCIVGLVGAMMIRNRPGYEEKLDSEGQKCGENLQELQEPVTKDDVNLRLFNVKEIVTVLMPTRTYIALFMAYGFYIIPFFGTLYMVVNYPRQMGKDKTIYERAKEIPMAKAASIFSFYGAGHTSGPIFAGIIGVKVDAKLLGTILFVIAGICSMCWTMCRSYAGFAVMMLFIGALNSGSGVIFTTVIGERYQGPNIGIAMALVFIAGLCGIAGAPIVTKLFVVFDNYKYSCIFNGCCQFIGAVILYYAVPNMNYYAFYRNRFAHKKQEDEIPKETTISCEE